MEPPIRKPHLLRIKKEIVNLVDAEIEQIKKKIKDCDPGFEKEDRELKRDLAIWIRQRNKLAKDADMEVIELTSRDLRGSYVYQN